MLVAIANLILRAGGWTRIGAIPDVDKAVFIIAPHTSNWDGFWGLVCKVSFGLDAHFFGKAALFWFPLGTILRAMGCVPLDRALPGTAVSRAIEELNGRDRYFFGLAPEGTRSRRPHWKSGFYRIAVGAGVPVVCCPLDYGRRQIGIGPTISLTGDVDADMARIREFYADVEGKHPDKASPVRLANEAAITQ